MIHKLDLITCLSLGTGSVRVCKVLGECTQLAGPGFVCSLDCLAGPELDVHAHSRAATQCSKSHRQGTEGVGNLQSPEPRS